MQIALRGGDIRVLHSLFYLVDVGASDVQPGAKRMSQIVNAKLGQADVIARCIERPPD